MFVLLFLINIYAYEHYQSRQKQVQKILELPLLSTINHRNIFILTLDKISYPLYCIIINGK